MLTEVQPGTHRLHFPEIRDHSKSAARKGLMISLGLASIITPALIHSDDKSASINPGKTGGSITGLNSQTSPRESIACVAKSEEEHKDLKPQPWNETFIAWVGDTVYIPPSSAAPDGEYTVIIAGNKDAVPENAFLDSPILLDVDQYHNAGWLVKSSGTHKTPPTQPCTIPR